MSERLPTTNGSDPVLGKKPDGRGKSPNSAANLTGGSRLGKPNKTTATMKAAIMSVYERLQQGHPEPHGHFVAWATDNPKEFYTQIAPKLIPVQVAGSDDPSDAPLGISVTFVKPKAADGE